jgi:flagellar basal body-associated protein FliL
MTKSAATVVLVLIELSVVFAVAAVVYYFYWILKAASIATSRHPQSVVCVVPCCNFVLVVQDAIESA